MTNLIPVLPPRWDDAQLHSDRIKAIDIFRDERLLEPLERFGEEFEKYEDALNNLLESTVDLTQILPQAVNVMADKASFEVVRYLAAPPVSKDDLLVIAKVESASAKSLRKNPADATAMVRTVLDVLDRKRFPWVMEGRDPTEQERQAAVLASAVLVATQRVQTLRRNEGKQAQEEQVRQALLANGYTQVARRTINTLSKAPDPGEFCLESALAGRKGDLIVRLQDGRVMPIECKVSNSFTNSIKRLNNDAAVKAVHWTKEFGPRNIVPTAVLSGAFKLSNLQFGQTSNLTLFWAHDLDRMINWINTAT
jgi:hypothetical protein